MRNFVIFGASGDLASAKIFPALWEIYQKGYECNYYGYGRKEFSSSEFQNFVTDSIPESSSLFRNNFNYISGNYDIKSLQELKDLLGDRETTFYFALPTRLDIIENVVSALKKSNLFNRDFLLVIEKPFGEDFNSAKKLLTFLEQEVGVDNLFLIDHYLAKDSIRNLISLRFANPIFENMWSNIFINKIEITALEDMGVKGRGEYYDKAGAIKDMIQSHILQILCLVTMNKPNSIDSESIHEEKSNVLKDLQMYQDNFENNIFIGQYKGYLQEESILNDSLTETFASLTLEINNARWKGVPITVKTGKKQKERITQIVIYFKGFNDCIWNDNCDVITANKLEINIYPENDIQLYINSHVENSLSKQTPLEFNFSKNYPTLQPYANALIDIYNSEKSYTPSIDEILFSWKFVDRVEEFLKDKRSEMLDIY